MAPGEWLNITLCGLAGDLDNVVSQINTPDPPLFTAATTKAGRAESIGC